MITSNFILNISSGFLTWINSYVYARRSYLSGDPTAVKGTVERTTVSNAEIWCECFGKNLSELKATDSYSSTKYTAWHWHCNAKFQKRKYCETPTLKEESLEETFVEVFNGLIADKDEIMENYRLCIDAVTDDSEYRRQLEDLNNGCGEVQTLIRSLLMTYSRQDTAEDIHEKLQEYEERLDTMARLKQELDLKIAACAAKRVQITGFLNELMKHDAPLAKFDPLVWQAVINYATVNRDCTITFTFRDGTEKTVPIKNGVRPYTKRNKPQEVDGNDG